MNASKSIEDVRELDPNGTSPNQPGAKLDGGKVRPELIIRGFSDALMEVARVGTFGANKYSDDGWKEVPNAKRRYTDAMYRHLLKEHMGYMEDPDSNLLHAAHTAWNALARLQFILEEIDEQHDPIN